MMISTKGLIAGAVLSAGIWGVVSNINHRNYHRIIKAPISNGLLMAVDSGLYSATAGLACALNPISAPIILVATIVGTATHIVHQSLRIMEDNE